MAHITDQLEFLVDKKDLNYQKAISYYRSRKNTLIKQLNTNANKYANTFLNKLTEYSVEWGKKVSQKIMTTMAQNFNNTKIWELTKDSNLYNSIIQDYPNVNWSSDMQSILSVLQGNGASMPGYEVISKLGFGNEDMLPGRMNIGFEQDLSNLVVGQSMQKLISGLNLGKSGGLQSKTAFQSRKNIRPDQLLSYDIELKDDGKILSASNRGANNFMGVELQVQFDLDQIALSGMLKKAMLRDYKNLKLWGISQKSFSSKYISGKKFSENSGIQSKILRDYSLDHPHTWDTTYLDIYTSYALSKYLINIIGPINTIFLMKDKYLFFDEFLETKEFYMKIQTRSLGKNVLVIESSRHEGAKEVHPTITDSGIYIREKGKSIGTVLRYNDNKERYNIVVRRSLKKKT